ncbi:endo-1,4-beta-xylanase [Saonia flava]|uniref:Beta-xylanase n=1 Tax=Saonia flava TaxID=523696 RepID=A0A846QP51_9FLAO|nr:endo-1,4-beta-xylanase [Saonia flava]NJB69851.1 endo-1,4-beta-xylanase [Saonia flava]
MKAFKTLVVLTIALITYTSCKEKTVAVVEEEIPSLKASYENDFLIGSALNGRQINEEDSVQNALIAREFNSYTAENIMKSMHIHPAKDTFNFEMPDKLFALAEKNGAKVHGHTLIWHSQLSSFFYGIKDSTEMVSAMTDHINTIAGRYAGKLDSWDVVNEAVEGDGSLRKSVFLNVLGEDYLPLSFKLAAAADPQADLYYNDYSMTGEAKRKGVIEMVKKIQESGAKIDGIGMQGHWHLDSPSLEEIETSILEYAALGVKVAITELDIDVLPNPRNVEGADISQRAEIDAQNNPYVNGLPDSINVALAKRYEDLFKLFLKHSDKISRVTLWGVNDGDSWKNNFPARGRTNYCLLFDRNNQPKKAYESVMALKENKE